MNDGKPSAVAEKAKASSAPSAKPSVDKNRCRGGVRAPPATLSTSGSLKSAVEPRGGRPGLTTGSPNRRGDIAEETQESEVELEAAIRVVKGLCVVDCEDAAEPTVGLDVQGVIVAKSEKRRSLTHLEWKKKVAKKRRLEVSEAVLTEAGDTYEIWDVKSMLGREGAAGNYRYWVEWANHDGPPELLSLEDCMGAPDWVHLIDSWYKHRENCMRDGKEPKSLQRYLASQQLWLTLGGDTSFTCVFRAVAIMMQLVTPKFADNFPRLRDEFEQTLSYDLVQNKGLTRDDTNKLFDFLTSKKGGWKVEIQKNQYQGQYNGFCRVAVCVKERGLYLVAGIDKKRQGHCFVLQVSDSKENAGLEGGLEFDAYENGMVVGLGDIDIQEILWVRKVVKSKRPMTAPVDAGKDVRVEFRLHRTAKKSEARKVKRSRLE
ncbi:Hypothetical protein PHPALM_10240 [Phytophthora palmivora]|uniref:Chromo domain-containing protein n=1 Tax=Phytophthora palmivora TaxID=4796 RepID=A0A2P4Y591_9STRA|nr:Hypothetical protein PHPALM_10240 [Phytophthora palmivora]